MRNPTSDLIELRHYYESLVAQSESQAIQAKEQIGHIDALLVNSLLQTQGQITVRAEIVGNVPALSAAQRPIERAIQASPKDNAVKAIALKAKPEATKSSRGRESFPLLPQYRGMTKLEAISQILAEQSGHVLHQDTITQLLYGDLSSEVLKVESRRMRASLFQGVTKGLWQRAPKHPSCYITKSSSNGNGRQLNSANQTFVTAAELSLKPTASPAKPGRKPSTLPKNKAIASIKPATRGRTQVLSLPAQYSGLSKIDAVAKVLEKNPGSVMHMDEIIEHLYGKLTDNELKAEKVRMKDVMTRGVQRKLWQKAKGVPSSIFMGEPTNSSVKKNFSKVTVLQPQSTTVKKPRKSSPLQAEKPKRKKAEVVALLRNANIKI
jgi:hypothetical protein